MTDKVFTPEELARYNGKDGMPAYLACFGLVYDGSDSWAWETGRHMARHDAGKDLTDHISQAPHGREFLKRLPIVGRMEGQEAG
ncbi:MAG: cytochrome b5 domain-containing protein [Dehalococcoidia bacterium]|nr:cytochrome b5 domain-containing protein [Dehalococcoidia bacterium]